MNQEIKLTDGAAAPASIESQLRAVLFSTLAPLAAQKSTAREAYAALARVVARIEGDVPTGARLVGLLQLFNAQRPEGVAAIPVGTAGVAQDCVAAYRKSLVSSANQGVGSQLLPPDLVDGLNRWLERLIELLGEGIRRPYEAEKIELQARADDEIAALRLQTDEALQAARSETSALQAELIDSRQQLAELQRSAQAQQQRLDEQAQQIALASSELRELASRNAVLQARVDEQAAQNARLQDEARQARQEQDDERRQRMLAIDAARTVEQELAREKERRKAAEGSARAAERYLDEEKVKVAELQAALARIHLAAESAVAAQRPAGRIKPARAGSAAPVRRKSLR